MKKTLVGLAVLAVSIATLTAAGASGDKHGSSVAGGSMLEFRDAFSAGAHQLPPQSGASLATASDVYNGPTPDAPCAPGALPESTQGRVPLTEVQSGRAAKGYHCNAVQLSRNGSSGGYHVYRYSDRAGHTCAYYDTTLLLGRDARYANFRTGPGTVVLDMQNPRSPIQTDLLTTPAMVTPHESLRLHAGRGLLVAVAGTPVAAPGQLDVYDVSKDCRHPELLSSTPTGLLGHESGFTPDGMTYWATSWLWRSGTLTAIDLANPRQPKFLTLSAAYVLHGLSFSADGKTLYGADQGDPHKGLRILDVSEVQERKANPQIRQLAYLRWPEMSTPQINEPITINGKPYTVEIDEFNTNELIGAARLIDIADIRHPRVVSNMRLAVNQPGIQQELQQDPGFSGIQSYTGHYCSVPRRTNPNIVACSFILSGLRVFDIRNPLRPVEVAYFNPPSPQSGPDALNPVTRVGSFAMSAPAFDVKNGQVWYTDGNSGFYALQLVGAARAALDGISRVPAGRAGPLR